MKKIQRDKLRIAMIGHKRIPSREGGIEIVVEEIATRMVRDGYPVTAYNRRGHHISGKKFDDGSIKKKDEYNGVKLITVPTIEKRGLSALTSSFFAAWKAAFGKYDIVHFHAEGPSVMLLIPRLFRKKTVVTIHGLDWKCPKWSKKAVRYLKLGEKIAIKYADQVIVLSNNIQQYFLSLYGKKPIFIPNGISKPQICNADLITERFHLENRRYILFLGRIVLGKGIEYLINAYNDLVTDYKLVIAGGASDSTEYMDELVKKAQKNNNIIFTDFVQGKVLDELYSNAYFYVLPSDSEGMPISLLEAMSYGNCCLASDIPEITEVLQDKGMTFKRSNVDDLREKMTYLIEHNEIVDKYRSEAAEYICSTYDWDKTTEKILEAYHNIMR